MYTTKTMCLRLFVWSISLSWSKSPCGWSLGLHWAQRLSWSRAGARRACEVLKASAAVFLAFAVLILWMGV